MTLKKLLEEATVCGGSFISISIWTCGDHPNERWDVHLPDKPFCIPCEVKKLRNHAAAFAELVEAGKGVVELWQDPKCHHVPDGAIALLETALRRVEW